ncbi:hypothetical protein L226DRAFT_569382 [Lentinus tigrinus ALCF2SS1-7]|uniref:uncharacterized protein n=1 Tax=Lentinus tigrinus ALCF2SS1-7 TaxID=1328758 RepID=UPI0011662AD8|nr:hypothetical protein L226DRAFT_569382 [Lentinus tigrinus ALCF2SS1-7]
MKIAASGDAESRRARQSAEYKAPASAHILSPQNHDVLSPQSQVLCPGAVPDTAPFAQYKLPIVWVRLRVTTSFTSPLSRTGCGGRFVSMLVYSAESVPTITRQSRAFDALESLLDVDGLRPGRDPRDTTTLPHRWDRPRHCWTL